MEEEIYIFIPGTGGVVAEGIEWVNNNAYAREVDFQEVLKWLQWRI